MIWKCMPQVRWASLPKQEWKELQQLWRNEATGRYEWRPVPTERVVPTERAASDGKDGEG